MPRDVLEHALGRVSIRTGVLFSFLLTITQKERKAIEQMFYKK